MANMIRTFIRDFDEFGDELSENTIYEEYFIMLNISLLYVPLKSFSISIVRFLQLVLTAIIHFYMITICLITAVVGRDDFIVSGGALNYAIITFTFDIILLHVISKRKNIAQIHYIIGSGFYEYNETLSSEMIHIKSKYKQLIWWIKRVIPVCTCFCGTVLLCLGPLIDRLAGVKVQEHPDNGINYNLPVPTWIPYYSNGSISYWITVISIVISVTLSINVFISFNILYFTISNYIACQLELLKMSIRNIEIRANHIKELHGSYNFTECLKVCLKKNIEHHQAILSLHHLANEVFSVPIFIFFLLGGMMVALASYGAISVTGQPGAVLNFVDISVVQMFTIGSMCKMGQTLIDLHMNVRQEVYSIDWYRYSTNISTSLIIIQQICLRDLIFKGPFGLSATMETFADILNTTYSYFSLIVAWQS
ncbi:odorant receptor 67c-like isoform X3 [Rhodnius prolixus]|uniref:odorant receptor 67c-like isoform X3 n=1 Tax=Rhodnius prolixus TaxID=13249 RepID=UPI003D18D86C